MATYFKCSALALPSLIALTSELSRDDTKLLVIFDMEFSVDITVDSRARSVTERWLLVARRREDPAELSFRILLKNENRKQ